MARIRKRHTGGLFKALLLRKPKKTKSESLFGSLSFNYYGKNTF